MKKIKLSCLVAVSLIISGCNYSKEPVITDGVSNTAASSSISDFEASFDNTTSCEETTTAEITDITAQASITDNVTIPAATNAPHISTAAPTTDSTPVPTAAPVPPITASKPSQYPLDKAGKILSKMSIEEKIGQVILCRYYDNADQLEKTYHFGGFTLYAKDFENETESSLKEKLAEISRNTSVPPFIAADEEGGYVVRISKYPQFSSSPLPALMDGAKDIDSFGNKMAQVLKKAGVNLNLAPVADVAQSQNDYIYGRTCGLDYKQTGQVISKLVKILNDNNIMCCLKHFPGYGSNVDTHTGIAVDNRSKSDFEAKDFLPFKSGIQAGAPMVMVNHNIVTAYNKNVPASLAPEIHSALRNLGFEGIIVTDDLGMGAITQYSSDPYTDAFLAGNDLLCATDGAACCNSLYKAAKSGKITESRLDESVYRIITAKIRYGIIQ